MPVADLSEWISASASRDPEKLLIEADDRNYTYGSALQFVRGLAGALGHYGVTPGDRVAVQVEKSAEAFLLYLACLECGAVFVPLNTSYTSAELAYFLQDAEPRLFVVSPENEDASRTLVGDREGDIRLATLGVDCDGTLLEAIGAAKPYDGAGFDRAGSALAALLYTSGTTGRPKGAMLTRDNLATNAAALAQAWQFTSRDIVLHALPIFHAHGLFIAGNTVLASGASMIFRRKFDADDIIANLARCTVFMGVPTFYTRLLASPLLTAETCRTVRLFVSGSAPLLAETHRAFSDRTSHRILERYAMTETLVISSNPYEGERKPGAVGFALPQTEVRLADLETGEVLAHDDAIGVFEVRSPSCFEGYWRNPEKTAEDVRPDGFFTTGDIGQFDSDGYLQIIGRAKDLIITGGYNVYPKEVEEALDALPGVLESTVIGVKHPDFGEAVVGLVVPKSGVELEEGVLMRDLADKIARYKQPKKIYIVDDLPRNSLGKIQKALLRESYKDLFKGT